MAEELDQRRVDVLASFVAWDEGRRKLDGMSRGKRWDIDRESRREKLETEALCKRLSFRRWYHDRGGQALIAAWCKANRDRRNAWQRAWRALNPQKTKAYCKVSYARHRTARKAAGRVRAKAWYRANKDRARQYAKKNAAQLRSWHNARYAAKRGSKVRHRPCGACRKPGHNRRTCPATPAAPRSSSSS